MHRGPRPSVRLLRPSSECTKGGRADDGLSESPKVRKASGIEYVPPPQQHQWLPGCIEGWRGADDQRPYFTSVAYRACSFSDTLVGKQTQEVTHAIEKIPAEQGVNVIEG